MIQESFALIDHETVKIIRQGYYTNRQKNKVCLALEHGGSFEDVDLYPPDATQSIVDVNSAKAYLAELDTVECAYCITQADSFTEAQGMQRPLVMNFANAHRPGGSFFAGARAQEESLCRSSTLYVSLASEKASQLYSYNNEHLLPGSSDYMLISPHVLVFRDNKNRLLEQPFQVAVITIPAPDLRCLVSDMSWDSINKLREQRLRRMLCVAAKQRYRSLVLGAWGCGVFCNNPTEVAQQFYNLLIKEQLGAYFQQVSFAIYGGGRNYEAFCEQLGSIATIF